MKKTPEKHVRDLLRSRHTLLWCETREERRAERAIASAATREGYAVRYWDCSTGVTDVEGKRVALGGDIPETNPHACFEKIRARDNESAIWIMRDLHRWLDDVQVLRAVKSLARELQDEMDRKRLTTIVVLCTVGEVPEDLRSSATMVDWPLPTREEIGKILDDAAATSGVKLNGDRERIVDAAAGLPADDIASAFALSIVQHRKIDAGEVSSAKRAIVDREKVLRWYEPDERGLDAIGGLDLLKTWLVERRLAFSPAARAYGLPPVKGVLLVGPSGTGKSLTAKAVATAFGVPLLRLDLAALKGGIVGSSEGNIRRALKTAEAIQSCVLWIDELEKAIAGARGGGGDSGVSADQLGTLLTWMQETTLPIFTVATSNDPVSLPPELVSRFDESCFVDLPTRLERIDVLHKTTLLFGRKPVSFDLADVAGKTAGFSGRELAKLVGSSMFRAFADGQREVRTDDLLVIAGATIPVSKSAAETVTALRRWADGRARRASAVDEEAVLPNQAGAGLGRFATVAGGEEN